MDETLEIERCREIEAELRGMASKERLYGSLSTGCCFQMSCLHGFLGAGLILPGLSI